ncbi:hypothetical protein JCM10207_003237 [Rhodosporidiobolus poonsookiae]
MDNKAAFTRITKRVTLEKSILTYRLAARELGVSVNDAKSLLAAYLDTDQAKERGVSAVHLVSGYLIPNPSSSQNGTNGDRVDSSQAADAMQVDGDDQDMGKEVIRTRTVRLVPAAELEASLALFSPPPTSHIYALAPSPLAPAQLPLLHTASLSLVPPAARERWKPPPADAPAYGALVHPDGERKRRPGEGARGGATSAAERAGPSAGTSKAGAKKEKEEKGKKEDVKPAVKGAKGKDKAADNSKGKGKKADTAPKIRPIGQLGGLFARQMDEPAKKGKGKGKKAASSDEEDEEENEDSDEDIKPQPRRTVPAKRKSSPTVSRSSSVTTAAVNKPSPVAPAPAAKGKSTKAPSITLDDDDDDEWAMDEEALVEMEREAQRQAEAKKAKQGGAGAAPAKGKAKEKEKAPPREGETKAERQKRELEEMMNDDDAMDVDEKKPAKPASKPALARSGSSSSSTAKPKPKPAGKAGAQGSITGFFGKK